MWPWVKGTFLKCTLWLSDAVYNGRASFQFSHIPLPHPPSSICISGHFSQLKTKLSVLLTPHTFPYRLGTYPRQPKARLKFWVSSPYLYSDLWGSYCWMFSFGKLTSKSPSTLAHFSISVNSSHIAPLLRFKTSYLFSICPLTQPSTWMVPHSCPSFSNSHAFISTSYCGYV